MVPGIMLEENDAFWDGATLDWLQPPAVEERRALLGLHPGSPAAFFAESCEFIGLGCTCQVTRSLQALGLKRFTYPFDWLQSPLSGVIHLFRTDFEDFLTFTFLKDEPHMAEKVSYTRARWGGSFWHHDVEDPEVRDAFERRIRRLLGMLPEVSGAKTRVFVRSVSSTRELDLTLRLYEVLKDALPESRIYLLIIVDLQESEEMIALQSTAGLDVLFFRVSEEIFLDQDKFDRQKVVENYARGIACAVNVWTDGTCPATFVIEPSLQRVSARCDQMDSGDPGSEAYWPRRFRGQRFVDKPIHMPRLFEQKVADFVIPDGMGEGDLLTMTAFGIEGLEMPVPPSGAAGQVLRLRLADGKITAGLLVTVSLPADTASDTASSSVLAAPAVDAVGATDVRVERA